MCTHLSLTFIYSGYFYSASSSPLLLRGTPDTARILFHTEAPQALSEGLAQGLYVAARAGFEPTTFQTKGVESNNHNNINNNLRNSLETKEKGLSFKVVILLNPKGPDIKGVGLKTRSLDLEVLGLDNKTGAIYHYAASIDYITRDAAVGYTILKEAALQVIRTYGVCPVAPDPRDSGAPVHHCPN